jgi:hypothetical protein
MTDTTTGTPELNKALAAFQASLPAIAKGETAQIPGKEGRQGFTYHYADLADVSDVVMPNLGKHGLAFTASPTLDDGKFVLAYTLLHESGEERSGTYPLPSSGKPQDIGGVITYARRYCLCAVTGVAPGGEDNDAAGATEVAMDRPQRTRTRIPGPDHERLQPRRQPDDRPAERGPVPPEQDLWQDQPPGDFDAATVQPEDRPGGADGKQLRDIHTRLTRLGITDRDQGLRLIEEIIVGPLDGPHVAEDGTARTSKNLSWQEAKRVVSDLDGRIKAAKAEAEAATP